MNKHELHKTVMDSGPHVENRYEMILQPVLPNITTPRLKSTWTWKREDKTNRTNLLQTLETTVAVQSYLVLENTLMHLPVGLR